MQATYLNNLFRVYTAEPNNQGRWSDADVYTLLNEAQNWVALHVNWPILHLQAVPPNGTQVGIMEYTLPDQVMSIDRAYIAGQPCPTTDIETLEGIQLEYYDQSNTPTYTPQWSTQTSAAFPVTNTQMGYPQGVSPFYSGDRPVVYMNGGNLGIVPPPAGQYQIDLWGQGLPNAMSATQLNCDFPQVAASCIAWNAVSRAFAADSQLERATYCLKQAMDAMADVRVWREGLLKNRPRGIRPITYRNHYGRATTLGSGWNWRG